MAVFHNAVLLKINYFVLNGMQDQERRHLRMNNQSINYELIAVGIGNQTIVYVRQLQIVLAAYHGNSVSWNHNDVSVVSCTPWEREGGETRNGGKWNEGEIDGEAQSSVRQIAMG